MTQKYQVLARRYRPQQFRDVVGQEIIVTTLKNSLRLQKVASAYLFSGSRGTGKTTLARLFAKTLNCQKLSQDFEPCNECSSCLDIMGGNSLDVIEIDGASNRGIDDIRQINEQIGYIPAEGRYKIYIIDEVHMLTKEAFNALLKTLEEPPQQAKFFFATTEPHKVLPTIISRCQRFDLKRISLEQITSKLEQIAEDLGRSVEKEALFLIAEKSDGSLRDAESLLDQLLCFSEGEISRATVQQVFGLLSETHFFALDQAFSEYRLAYAFELSHFLYHEGKDLSHFFSQLIEHYRKIALCKTFGEKGLSSPYTAQYTQAATSYTQAQSLYILEYLIREEVSFQKSILPLIFLETVLLHIIRSKNRIPAEVLVRCLSEIQAQGGLIPSKISMQEEPSSQRETSQAPLPKIAAQEPLSPLPQSKPVQEPKKVSPPEIAPQEKGELPFTPQRKYEKKGEDLSKPSGKRPSSDYDTLIRFAAVELEGSVKKP